MTIRKTSFTFALLRRDARYFADDPFYVKQQIAEMPCRTARPLRLNRRLSNKLQRKVDLLAASKKIEDRGFPEYAGAICRRPLRYTGGASSSTFPVAFAADFLTTASHVF